MSVILVYISYRVRMISICASRSTVADVESTRSGLERSLAGDYSDLLWAVGREDMSCSVPLDKPLRYPLSFALPSDRFH